jgi:hypothetical protein
MPRGLAERGESLAPGYVLFNPLRSSDAYLVDRDGQVVNVWKTPYAAGTVEFRPNGNLLRLARDPEATHFKAGGTAGILQELAWDGSVVWEWKLATEERVLHHDIELLPNGNLLALGWEVIPPADARAAGRRVDQIPEVGLWPDFVIEVEPVPPADARIVWEWRAWDHLIQDQDESAPNHGDPAAHPERIDLNAGLDAPQVDPEQLEQLKALGYVPPDATVEDQRPDFLHANAVAYHAALDQIAISVPTFAEIWVIDHGTTNDEAAGSTGGRRGRGGDLLYRFGNRAAYRRGSSEEQRFFYQHDVRWIPDGFEGAGNLMVFNNGRDRPAGAWSSVDEWTPPLEDDGSYRIDAGAPFGPAELAWHYRAPEALYSAFISAAQRLANGNTFVTSGAGGELFEVTSAGEIVWSYRNPYSGDVRLADGTLPQPGAAENPYGVFRATFVPANDPALEGRALTPLDPQPVWYDWKPEEP